MKLIAQTTMTLGVLLAVACTGPRPLHGGHSITTAPIHQTLRQSDNPSASSRQTQETIRTRNYTLPAGSRVLPSPTAPPNKNRDTQTQNGVELSAPIPVVDREEIRATTELGPAQKDTAREFTAKLSSLKGIVWVGLGLFIFGLASIFYAPLRIIIASLTTSVAITLGGVTLMVLPTLIVGNELFILGGVAVVVGAWFLAHRHGHARGQLARHQSARPSPSSVTLK